jgi:hypothetical protein
MNALEIAADFRNDAPITSISYRMYVASGEILAATQVQDCPEDRRAALLAAAEACAEAHFQLVGAFAALMGAKRAVRAAMEGGAA